MKWRDPDTGEIFDDETGNITAGDMKPQQAGSDTSGAWRQLLLGTRNVLEGGASVADIPSLAYNALGQNKVDYGAGIQNPGIPAPYPSQMVGQALTAAGMPTPMNDTERLYSAMQRGGAGAIAGMGAGGLLAGPQMMANPAMQAISGIAGGGSAEAARQAGAPPLLQTAAGYAGGMAPYPVSAGLQSAGRVGAELTRPLSAMGVDRVAGRVLNELAVNPEAAILRAGSSEGRFVGSPTMGQASGDLGILGAEKYIQSKDPIRWGMRQQQQNLARNGLLDKLAGTEENVKTIETLRDQATSQLRNNAFAEQSGPVNTSSVDALAKSILEGPERKRTVVTRAIEAIRGKLSDTKTVNGEQVKEYITDIPTLYGVRKEINDKLAGLSSEPTDRLASRELIRLKDALDTEISKVSPSWRNYLSEYARYSTKIDRLNELQRMQGATVTAIPMRGAEDELIPVINRSKWASQVEKKLKDLNPALTSGQTRNLERITQDLKRTASPPELRVPGSDTFANFSVANVIGNIIGNKKFANSPAAQKITRSVGWLYSGPDQAILDRLSQAMLDPQLSVKLMQRATDENLRSVVQIINGNAQAHVLGSSYGLLGAQQ